MAATDLPAGDMAFFDHYIPSLEDGEYTITVKTAITGGIDTQGYFEDPITQAFEVRGPQFALPVNEVHSVYPPLNSNSIYDQYLPNIVLNKRVLPWERAFNTSDKTIPWVCLLVFADGELPADPQTHSSLLSGTVSDFLAPDGDVLKPAIPTDTVAADVLSSVCTSIRVTQAVFNAVAPKVAELPYLAHVRQVDTGNQAILGFEDRGWFSVVTGNRLLKTTAAQGTRYSVHLVSLEGYEGIMTGATPWPNKQSAPTQPKDIALASLYNWTFLSQPEQLDFEQLVENFATQAAGQPDNLLLRRQVTPPAQPTPAQQASLARLQDGYIPMAYNVPGGERSFAWYRGPLTPVIAQPLPRPSDSYHYPSASSAMIYDKASGIFDQSYAAAWSLGRALALSDATFSQEVMKFRRNAYALVGKLMDALVSADDASQADLAAVISSSAVRDTFKDMVTKDLSGTLAGAFSSPPLPRTGRTVRRAAPAPQDPVELAKAFLGSPDIQAFLQEAVRSDLLPVAAWLANAQLLYSVPFDHLVPDQEALPVESLRFFYMDQNWLDCLADGALSIGIQSSKDAFYTSIMAGVINDAVAAEVQAIRSRLAGTSTGDTEPDTTAEAMSGVLIRSAVVAGWPGLNVCAYKGDYATGTPLKLLRMDRLSSSILLCIFLDIPDTVVIAEPQQGLCFGVEDGEVINLRQLTGTPGKPTGKSFPASGGFSTFYRNASTYVLNINDGAGSVVQTLQLPQYLNTTITPAQFALEMVKSPEEISFARTTT